MKNSKEELVPSIDLFVYLFNQLCDSTELTPEEVSQQLEFLLTKNESFPILLSLLANDDQRIVKCASIFISQNSDYLSTESYDENFYINALNTIFPIFASSSSSFSEYYTETIWKISKLFDSTQILNEFFHTLIENNDLFHAIQISILLININYFDISVQFQLIEQGLLQYNDEIMLKYILQLITMIILNQEISLTEEQNNFLTHNLTNLVLRILETKNEKDFNIICLFLSNLPFNMNFFSITDLYEPLVESFSQETTKFFHYISFIFFNLLLSHNIEFDVDDSLIFQTLDAILSCSLSLYIPDATYEEQYIDGCEELIYSLFKKVTDYDILKQYIIERISSFCEEEGEEYFAIAIIIMNSAIQLNQDIFSDCYSDIFEIIFYSLNNGSNALKTYVIDFLSSLYSTLLYEKTNASSIPSFDLIQKLFELANESDFSKGVQIIPRIIISLPSIDSHFQEIYESAQNLLLYPDFEYASACFNIIESLIMKSKTSFFLIKKEIWEYIFSFYQDSSEERKEYPSFFKRLASYCFPILISKDKETVATNISMILEILSDIINSEDISEFSIGLNIFINTFKSCPEAINEISINVYQRIASFITNISIYNLNESFIRMILIPCTKCLSICAKIMEINEENIEYFQQLLKFITILIQYPPSQLFNESIELFYILLLKLSQIERFSTEFTKINMEIIKNICTFIDKPSYYIALIQIIRKFGVEVLCGQEDFIINEIFEIFQSSLTSQENLDQLLNILTEILKNLNISKKDSLIQERFPIFMEILSTNPTYSALILIKEFIELFSTIPEEIIVHLCSISLEILSLLNPLFSAASDLLLQIFTSYPFSLNEYFLPFLEIFKTNSESMSQSTRENIVSTLCYIQIKHQDLEFPVDLFPIMFKYLPVELFAFDNSKVIPFLIFIKDKIPLETIDLYLQVIAKLLSHPISYFIEFGYDLSYVIILATILLEKLSTLEGGLGRLQLLLDSDELKINILLNTLQNLMNQSSE